MAKVIWKRKGKIKLEGFGNVNVDKKRARISLDGDNLRGLLCCCCFVPPCIVLAGILFLSGENTRVERIEKYRY